MARTFAVDTVEYVGHTQSKYSACSLLRPPPPTSRDSPVFLQKHGARLEKLVNEIKLNFESCLISDKRNALLAIAGKVQKGDKQVGADDVARARQQGATTR